MDLLHAELDEHLAAFALQLEASEQKITSAIDVSSRAALYLPRIQQALVFHSYRDCLFLFGFWYVSSFFVKWTPHE
jgi:hypothetical protein